MFLDVEKEFVTAMWGLFASLGVLRVLAKGYTLASVEGFAGAVNVAASLTRPSSKGGGKGGKALIKGGRGNVLGCLRTSVEWRAQHQASPQALAARVAQIRTLHARQHCLLRHIEALKVEDCLFFFFFEYKTLSTCF
jgi:hypothetical protein